MNVEETKDTVGREKPAYKPPLAPSNNNSATEVKTGKVYNAAVPVGASDIHSSRSRSSESSAFPPVLLTSPQGSPSSEHKISSASSTLRRSASVRLFLPAGQSGENPNTPIAPEGKETQDPSKGAASRIKEDT